MGTKIQINRQTHEEYQKDPAAFFEKQYKKAETEVEKTFWKERRELFKSEEQNRGSNGVLSKEEIAIDNASRLAKVLREGPSKMEKFVWWVKDVKGKVTSFFPTLKEYTPWITYPAVAGIFIFNLVYCIKYGLGMQGLFSFLITGAGIIWTINLLEEKKVSWHTTIAAVLVAINFLLLQVTSLAPVPNFSSPGMRGITTENFGVVVHKETGEITRVVDSSNWFIPAFQWSETVEWYGDNFSTQYSPVSLNINLENTSVVATPRLIPIAQPGDKLEDLPEPVEMFYDIEGQSHDKIASFLEESEVDIATREGLMQIKSLIESIETSIYQIEEVSDLTVITRRDDGARTSINYSAEEME